MGAVSSAKIELTTSLAEANLLRMRKQFEEARSRLADILEVHPDSVDGHVLMGDIFRDQGKLEDAAVNYRIAISLAPNDVPARRKLDDTERRLKALTLPNPSSVNATTASPTKPKSGRMDQFLNRDGYRGLINLILLVAGGLMLIVFIAAIFNAVSNSRSGDSEVVMDQRQPPGVSAPAAPAAQPPSGTTAPQQQPSTPSQPARSPSAPARVGTVGETNFLAQLGNLPEVQESGLQVNLVLADPRQHSVTLVVGAQNLQSAAIKTELLRKGLELSIAVFGMNPDIELVTVRFDSNLPDGAGRTYQTGFMGDIRRQKITETTGKPISQQSATELEPHYENVFWHSSWRNLLN